MSARQQVPRNRRSQQQRTQATARRPLQAEVVSPAAALTPVGLPPDHPTARPLRQAAILLLQRTCGNAYVQRLLARQVAGEWPTGLARAPLARQKLQRQEGGPLAADEGRYPVCGSQGRGRCSGCGRQFQASPQSAPVEEPGHAGLIQRAPGGQEDRESTAAGASPAARSANEPRLSTRARPGTGLIARQPDKTPPADEGWKDAPDKGPNKSVTTVDEQGKILPGKAASKGVWRVPVHLKFGYGGTDQGPAHESPEKRAVALIPNLVQPTAAAKNKDITVDVLLHFHGYGVGYRELKPKKKDYAGVLAEGQVRDVELYQMEQQLLSHVAASKRLLVAVLPQGSDKSDFGDVAANSDAYLKEVFARLIPSFLPEKAIPGRVIVSGHSGGGPTAMAVADSMKAKQRTDVLLFDAINSSCEKEEKKVDGEKVLDGKGNPVMVCKSPPVCKSEYGTVKRWVTGRIEADVQSLAGKPEDQQPAELKANGTRFRGYTSVPLTNRYSCSYGYYYNELKKHIETTIKALKVTDAVRNQLRQNYQVQHVTGSHERMMGQGNLAAALKD